MPDQHFVPARQQGPDFRESWAKGGGLDLRPRIHADADFGRGIVRANDTTLLRILFSRIRRPILSRAPAVHFKRLR